MLDAIAAGEAEKVVVARDLVGSVPADADLRRILRALSGAYPDTWTFAVDGLLGASPETLATVRDGSASARVLAGTHPRRPDADEGAAARILASEKDRAEHAYAVRSVRDALAPHVGDVIERGPFALGLPNVWHLATDLSGALSAEASALDLVRALHPTAAVAGTPTAAALDVIRRVEPFDRGRYAGPVGWIGQDGDGEWAVALRCAQVDAADGDARRITAHVGGGIVAGSIPDEELRETDAKLRPIADALR